MKKRGRKGGTHVGFVLSFVIFITFLAVLYSLLIEPIRNQENKNFFLDDLENEIVENVSSEVNVSSISVEESVEDCVRLIGLITDLEIDSKIVVKDENGETQTSYVIGNDLEISRSDNNNVFFKIYQSENFNDLNDTGEEPCSERSYEKGLVKNENYVFEKNIASLINHYESNYEQLKWFFNVPYPSEFGFGFDYGNGTNLILGESPEMGVYSKETQIEYFSNGSNIKIGKLNARIW